MHVKTRQELTSVCTSVDSENTAFQPKLGILSVNNELYAFLIHVCQISVIYIYIYMCEAQCAIYETLQQYTTNLMMHYIAYFIPHADIVSVQTLHAHTYVHK